MREGKTPGGARVPRSAKPGSRECRQKIVSKKVLTIGLQYDILKILPLRSSRNRKEKTKKYLTSGKKYVILKVLSQDRTSTFKAK